MKFNVGQRVSFLYERGGGLIRRIDEKKNLWIEDETGFERPFRENEVARIEKEDYGFDDDTELELTEDETLSGNLHTIRHETRTGRRKPEEVWEIDLHIEELLDSHASMSNYQILQKQMNEFRTFFNKACKKQVRKLVVIHGVGEGVLKEDIRLFLSKREHVEYYDADFREYGKGATEVIVHYNY